MGKRKIKEKENWALAQRQANQMGIVLTRRKNSQGEYVCYLNKRSKKGWLNVLWNRNRESIWITCVIVFKAGCITGIRILRLRCCYTVGARSGNTARTGWVMSSAAVGWHCLRLAILPTTAGTCLCKTLSKVFCEPQNLAVSKKSSNFAPSFGKIR